ncbi:MAG TPA: PDZ domain-containing protein [Rhodanobacteraceae bacterium]
MGTLHRSLTRYLGLAVGLSLGATLATSTPAHATTPATANGPIKVLIRYPTMHDHTVVFEAGGKLWKTTLAGGVATQLTDDTGFDLAPHFSPNGRWIAFTGWYQGNTDVYLIAPAGGPVKRLTWHSINYKAGKGQLRPGLDNIVAGWTPNSKDVVFLSRRTSFNPQVVHAFTVPVGGGLPVQLPLPWTGPLSFAPNGHEVAYNKLNRVYRPFHRKHYFGGQAQDIWTYNFQTQKSRQITHWKGADAWPMWHGNTIYFTSDRGVHGVRNLWSYSFKTNHFTQLTHFATYDIDMPTLGNTGVAFSDGGDLYVYLFSDHALHKIHVSVPINGLALQPHWVDASKHVSGADVAPNGKLAVFSANGALFTVPAKYGSTQLLTHDPAADARSPAWSPDGKQIAFILAKGRSDEIAMRSATDGTPRLLTHTGNVSYQAPLTWSPNGKWLTYVDSHQVLWLQNVATGTRYQVAHDPSARRTFTDLAWAPGNDWIAFSKTLPNQVSAIYLYHLTDHSLHQVSRGHFNDFDPTFSDNGKYLFFASVRLPKPTLGNFGGLASLESDGLYATTLRKNLPSPLAPRQPDAFSKSAKKHGKNKHKSGKHPGPLHIDLAGLMSRAVQLPVPAANIGTVVSSHGVVYYTTQPDSVFGGGLNGEQSLLRAYDLKTRKDKTLDKGVGSLALSADGSTLLYRAKGSWVLRPAKFDPSAKDEKLDLSHVRRWVEPRAEWDTAFNEAWRDVRDYFFNPELIQQKWAKLGDTYRKLLPYAADRDDVNWLIANMIGSFGESHMYVSGGDMGWKSPAATTADLGATFALDAASGRYRIKRILRGDNTLPGFRAPLAQPGLKVKAGDYILAINGQPLRAPTSPYALLLGTYGTTVNLRVASNAAGTGAWTIKVKPIANAQKLYLLAWTRHNRALVDKLSDGKIGYVYLNDFESTGIHEFLRQYYSQVRKQGLIIDDRWNLGGADILGMIVYNRLASRPVAMFTTPRGWNSPTPQAAFNGYMALIDNHGSASNGDMIAYMFKKAHLGPVIGDRTWAGVRGYDGGFQLLDGGSLTVSDNGMYGMNSQWVVENLGVIPDVTVHDKPGELNRGHDAQLETTVNILLHKIKAAPRPWPAPPAWIPAFPAQPAWPKCTDTPSTGTCG